MVVVVAGVTVAWVTVSMTVVVVHVSSVHAGVVVIRLRVEVLCENFAPFLV